MLKEETAQGKGFQPAFQNDHFLSAFITYSDQYANGRIRAIKRHLSSDEVFVLMRGSAFLLISDDMWENVCTIMLKPEKAYCIEAGTWHYLAVSEDALIFVTENNNVSAENTETMILEEAYEILGGVSAAE